MGTSAEIALRENYQRISYVLEGAEDIAIVKALKEIHDNIELQHLLEALLGSNPALTELSAMTVGYGCDPQQWHREMDAEGSPALYGRTFSHAYTLFIALQDTTAGMGGTEICPGTHYCSGDSLGEICEANKVGMHHVSGLGYWPVGSAALVNHQTFHRGGAHVDKDADERVVFIVSFVARPNDMRQLPHGTFYHMKWNMW